ncbi:helix-turn-helix domain-containing protein [Streptomyces mutabilis]|uniref:helix-turn-helix domain-containing protein n=1 Tax=Streptomyces TaxID=1883 RepID=UPI0036AAA7E3
MARMGRPKAELVLTAQERDQLEELVRRRSTPQALALRCRIVLACATGATNREVARQVGAEEHTVGKWRARFVRDRLPGLGDLPRPGGPRTVSDKQVAVVVRRTLESTPKNATHKTAAVKNWLLAHPRFHLHFTSTGSSWLNLVERWFAELTNKRIRRGVHTSVQALERDIRTWIKTWNEDPRPYVWVKPADEILERLASYLKRIPDSAD